MRTHSDKLGTVAAGLYAVQKDIKNPVKDASGAKLGGKVVRYLSLPALIDVAKPLLKDHNLLISQELTHTDGGVGITTLVMSNTGEWIEFGPLVMPHNNDPQQVGAVITYGRRYALAAVLGIAADDEDVDKVPAKVEPAPASSSSAIAGGMAEAGERGGADPYGEDGTVPPQTTPEGDERTASPEPAATPSGPSEAQRYMDEFHKGRPHKMKQSETVRNMQWCTGYGDVRCPYAIVTEP